MHKPRIYLWNVLVKGYIKNKLPFDAVSVYKQMHCSGVWPDEFTYPFVIKACSEMAEVLTGVAVHAHVVKNGLEFISMVRTELIIMYVKFGELGLADFLFRTMVGRDLVAWNAFISACLQLGYAAKAFYLFRQMGGDGIGFDVVTVVNILSICGHLGCLEIGEEIYENARKEGIVDCNIIVDNARLDMYVKCGNVETARDLFEKMRSRNVVSWSTMIVGYAINGESEKAFELFSKMQNYGVKPNYVSYLGVLSACSHAGLVREGQAYFNQMAKSSDKDIKPRKEHFACMVNLLGRSGRLKDAYELAKSMPMEPDPAVWGALLGACAIHQNIELGNRAADLLFEMESNIGSYYVLLSNMFAASGRWDRVDNLRLRMKEKRVRKTAGCSSVEFRGDIHIFYAGDRSHPQSDAIHSKLDDLIKRIKSIGYVPWTNSALHDVEMEEKEVSLSTHSEKLAIVFGLINVQQEHPIRVMKNLRTCEDCHTFTKTSGDHDRFGSSWTLRRTAEMRSLLKLTTVESIF
ncbi:hypothetical protein ACFE04_030213 [Oxalis oulophora]